jgi:hypothetical protein
MFRKDIPDNVQVQLPVIMYCYISESKHGLQTLSQNNLNNSRLAKHIECLPRLLRHPQLSDPHQMHGCVDRRLASPLQVEDYGVLAGIVCLQFVLVTAISASTRPRQRSMIATLLRRMSLIINITPPRHIGQDLSAFLVQSGIA